MVWIVGCNNSIVTDFYLNIIESAIKIITTTNVLKADSIDSIKNSNKNDYYIVARIIDAVKLYLKGRQNIIFWVQGVEPEESYMRHKNVFKKVVLEILERFILTRAKFVFFVSNTMKKHYEIKYGINFNERHYIMPCFNTNIHKPAFFKKGKYKNNVFVYIGSLSVWQRFDKVVAFYKCIEEFGIFNSKLLVLTSERQKATDILKKSGIRNYEVSFVNNDELPNILSDAKYGFIIRDDVIVNHVATPTKISTYLSCGVIPIYSSCLKDFHRVSEGMRYKILYDTDSIQNVLSGLLREEINSMEIYEEYKNVFSTYYNVDYHIKNIIPCVKGLLKPE
ncbi:hypothetical protein [Phosphitispora fastidiosa]|uniref:hypothetical protein n=1 Tax=Phosphitispora fastidiosa TaxID=2837202 RepID=UPI001E45F3D5|nr:hypothetical protein [Phosphitispora fastidiosa]MBU7007220.1 hypothetical protein [Phosphitispora fastidiosa]